MTGCGEEWGEEVCTLVEGFWFVFAAGIGADVAGDDNAPDDGDWEPVVAFVVAVGWSPNVGAEYASLGDEIAWEIGEDDIDLLMRWVWIALEK